MKNDLRFMHEAPPLKMRDERSQNREKERKRQFQFYLRTKHTLCVFVENSYEMKNRESGMWIWFKISIREKKKTTLEKQQFNYKIKNVF